MFWKRQAAQDEQLQVTIRESVQKLYDGTLTALHDQLKKLSTVVNLEEKVKDLREQVSTLEIDKSKKEEAYARKERELEHKVGLHKTQVAQDIALAKREATVKIQEENLAVDRKRFEEQMKFVTENFDKQTGYLTEIIGDLSKRLPSLAMTADVGKHQTRVR